MKTKFPDRMLAAIQLIIGVNGIAGGYYGMAGADGVPRDWLNGSPFTSYFIPGVILFTLVGIYSLFSSVAVWKGVKPAYHLSLISGMILLSWIAVQVIIIGFVSWLQPAMFILAIVVMALSILGMQVRKQHHSHVVKGR